MAIIDTPNTTAKKKATKKTAKPTVVQEEMIKAKPKWAEPSTGKTNIKGMNSIKEIIEYSSTEFTKVGIEVLPCRCGHGFHIYQNRSPVAFCAIEDDKASYYFDLRYLSSVQVNWLYHTFGQMVNATDASEIEISVSTKSLDSYSKMIDAVIIFIKSIPGILDTCVHTLQMDEETMEKMKSTIYGFSKVSEYARAPNWRDAYNK